MEESFELSNWIHYRHTHKFSLFESIIEFVESVKHLCFDDINELNTIVVYITANDIRRSNNNKNNLVLKINKIKANDKIIENYDKLPEKDTFIWFSENRNRQLSKIKKGVTYELVINCDMKSFISKDGKHIKYYDAIFKWMWIKIIW